MKLSSVQAIYSQFAADYEHVMRNEMQYTAFADLPRLVISAIGHQRAKILDLGCGTGLSSLLFLKRNWDVTGIDGTSSMLRRARKLPFEKLIQQDLESPWRVRDNSFDAIVMIGVMEYIVKPRELFRQARAKLADHGVFGVTVPHKSKRCTDANLNTYYKKEIVPIILDADFKIESCGKTLGFNDAGTTVQYWNFLLRKS